MQVEFQSTHVPFTDSMRQYAELRLGTAVDRLADSVGSIVFRVRRVSGSGRAAVQQCRAILKLRSGEKLIVSESDSDVYRAIDRVTDRTKLTLARRVARMQAKRRRRRRQRRRVSVSGD